MLLLGDASCTNPGTVLLGSGTELSSDPGFGGTELALLNLGTIRQTSAATTYLGGVFNDGTIAIDRGNLQIDCLHTTPDSTIAIGIAGSAAGTGYGTLTAYGGPAPDEPFRLSGLDLGDRGTLLPAWTATLYSIVARDRVGFARRADRPCDLCSG